MITTVWNVSTGEPVAEYTLPPDQAVICAYEQLTCNNWYTWRYIDPSQHLGYRRTEHGHCCHDYWAKHEPLL
jgi:hypothetical protein